MQLLGKKVRPNFTPTLTEVNAAAGSLSWLATQTRLDVSLRVSVMNQITAKTISPAATKPINSTIDYVLTEDRIEMFVPQPRP